MCLLSSMSMTCACLHYSLGGPQNEGVPAIGLPCHACQNGGKATQFIAHTGCCVCDVGMYFLKMFSLWCL